MLSWDSRECMPSLTRIVRDTYVHVLIVTVELAHGKRSNVKCLVVPLTRKLGVSAALRIRSQRIGPLCHIIQYHPWQGQLHVSKGGQECFCCITGMYLALGVRVMERLKILRFEIRGRLMNCREQLIF